MRSTYRSQRAVRRQRRRSGAVFLEFVVAMPILFFAFLAIFEFSFAMIAVDTSTTAVVQGARVGAFQFDPTVTFDNNIVGNTDPSGNNDIADQVALEMAKYLAVINVEIRQTGTAGKPNAYVRIVRGGVVPAQSGTAERGDLTLASTIPPTLPMPATDEIVVTLCYPLTSNGSPVPDFLSTAGFSLSTYRFEATSRALLE
jgi:Flp pilus assembly protein TadG